MSFTFNWPRFSDQFHYDAIQMLNTALNKGTKPPIIADKIEVVELEMGTQPPELEIRDIGDLTVDQFRGIFRLTYAGDAHLVLKTKVQANPLNHKQPDVNLMGGARGMLAAKHPLVVPMLLRLSHFKLSSYVVLVVSKQKGITLVFKTDPLQAVDINSTFDSIAVIQNFIQHEIEGQLRQMFREDLPGIIHRLSQQWVKAKVEAPYLEKRPPPPPPTPTLTRKSSQSSLGTRRPRPASSVTGSSTHRFAPHTSSPLSPPPTPADTHTSSHPDLENFDPTYGLRPEGLPAKSVFRGFGSLFVPNKGLADLAEEASDSSGLGAGDEEDEDDLDEDDADSALEEGNSFDFVDWDRTSGSRPPSSAEIAVPEYETIPAVGGGTVTRPRIYHAQSAGGLAATALGRSYSQTVLQATSGPSDYGSTFYSNRAGGTHTPDSTDSPPSRGSSSAPSRRTHSTALTDLTYVSAASAPHPHPHQRSHPDYPQGGGPQRAASSPALYMRRASVSSTAVLSSSASGAFAGSSFTSSSFATALPDSAPADAALDTPTLHQLSTLSTSNHTLSPYTRGLAHFTVRSVPPRSAASLGGFRGGGALTSKGTGAAGAPDRPKARRKRTYRLGGKAAAASPPASAPVTAGPDGPDYFTLQDPPDPLGARARERGAASPTPPSEFDVEDMDRYFPPHDAAVRKRRGPRAAASVGLGPGPSFGRTSALSLGAPPSVVSASPPRVRRPPMSS